MGFAERFEQRLKKEKEESKTSLYSPDETTGFAQRFENRLKYGSVGSPSAYEQGVIDDLTGRLGDYDWQSAYTYDIWDEEDAKRKEQGKMPLYQYNRYDLTDPVDKYLYDNGLPPKKDLEGFVEKAEKEAEDKAEETKFAEWREQAEQAKSGYAEPIITKSEDGSITFTETGKHTEASEGNGWFGAFTSGMKNAKFDNSGVQSRWDRMIWEMQNMQAPTKKELQPYVDALVAGGEYENEKEATKAAKDQYRKEQEQKWLEYVGAPKDAEGNFLYGSKYAYEGHVVADEMTRAAMESDDFKTMNQLNAEHAEDLNYAWDDIYKSTEGTSRSSAPIYDYMTDEQKAAYFYYKERGYGDEYLDALTPELTEQAAQATKETYKGTILGDALLALTGGLESGVKGLLRLVSDDYSARADGVSAQAAQQNRQEIAQSDDFWSKAAGLGLDILYSTGNMAPSLLVGAVNPLAGAVAMGASSAGNARVEARNEGATEEQAVLYGLMSGTAEGVLQYLLGGISKLGGVVTKQSFSKLLTGAMSRVFKNPKVANAFAQHISGALSEGLEEYVTGLIDPILRNVSLNENNVLNLANEDALYGMLLGAITGGLLGGNGTVATDTDTTTDARTTTNTPTAETAAQAEIQAPAETAQPETQPVDTRIAAGDTVILNDGTEAVVQAVNHDPFNDVEMYTVEHDGVEDILTQYDVRKPGLQEAQLATPTASGNNLSDMRNEAGQQAINTFNGRIELTTENIAGGETSGKTGWTEQAKGIQNKAGNQWRDVSRVLDDAAGKSRVLRDFLYEQIEKPHNKAKEAYARNTQQMTRAVKKAYDSYGIKADSPESKAVFNYTQGYFTDKNGDRVPYGYNDVVAAFPKSYENIIKASAWTRAFLDQYHGIINDSRTGIYENAERNAWFELEELQSQETYYTNALNNARQDVRNAQDAAAKETAQRRADDLQGILNSIQTNRQQLESNIAAGYYGNKRLMYRQDYMPHYHESPSAWGRMVQAFTGDEIAIDPEIVGRSADTQPKSQFSGRFFHQRYGEYVDDAVYALTRYVEEAERLVAFDPLIARMNDPAFGVIERVRRGAEGSPNANKFIAWMTNWTNSVAGKTNAIDRGILNMEGNPENRKWLDKVRLINGWVRNSTLLGNVRSALVQISNIPNAMQYIANPADWVSGMYRMAGHAVENWGWKKDNVMSTAFDQSGFMAGRTHDSVMRSMDDFTSTPSKLASAMLEIGDRGASELIWWSALSQYERLNGKVKGMRTYESAVDYADDVTRRSVAGRERGDKPVNQTSQFVNLIDPFKLETVNQLNTLRESIKNKRFGGIVASLVGTYALNELFKTLFNDTPISMDFVRVLADTIGALEDEENEEVQTVLDAFGHALWRGAGEVIASMPLGSQVLTMVADDSVVQGLFGESDPTRYGTANMGLAAVADPVFGFLGGKTVDPITALLSFVPAGKQANRMLETAEIQGWVPDVKLNEDQGFFTRQAETPTSYTATGDVRYAASSDPLQILQSMLFGQYATEAGSRYIEGETKPLEGKKAELYNDLAATGMNGQNIFDQLMALAEYKSIKDAEGKEVTSAADQKRAHIEDADLTVSQQMILMGSIDESFAENAAAAKELGISNEQFLEYEYARVRIEAELQEYRRDHDGQSPKGGKGGLLMEWLRSQDFTEQQAMYLYELHGDANIFIPGEWKGWD